VKPQEKTLELGFSWSQLLVPTSPDQQLATEEDVKWNGDATRNLSAMNFGS